MSTLNIPSSPSQGATYEANGVVYTWDGTKWKADSSYVSNLNGGPLAGFRNALINGGMEVFQRETGAPVVVSATSGQYVLDRWKIRSNVIGADTTITVQDITTSNHPAGIWKAIRMQNANVSVAPASNQYVGIQQPLEQSTTRALGFGSPLNQSLSIGFYIRSSVGGTYTFSVQSSGAPRKSYLFDFDVPADTTNWTYVSHTFPSNSDISFLTQEGGAIISLYLSSGSAFVGGANETWNDGELFLTSNASNNFTNTANATVDLTAVQLEPGPVATPFEQRPIGTELALCQRYFYYTGSNYNMSMYKTGTGRIGYVFLPTVMRTTPTVTQTNSQYVTSLSLSPYPNVVVLAGTSTDDSRGGYVGQISADAEL